MEGDGIVSKEGRKTTMNNFPIDANSIKWGPRAYIYFMVIAAKMSEKNVTNGEKSITP